MVISTVTNYLATNNFLKLLAHSVWVSVGTEEVRFLVPKGKSQFSLESFYILKSPSLYETSWWIQVLVTPLVVSSVHQLKKKKKTEEKSKGLPKPQPKTTQHGYSHLSLIALWELDGNFWVLSNKHPQWIRLSGTHPRHSHFAVILQRGLEMVKRVAGVKG